MKKIIKIFGILIIGLFVAVFCYPLFHEGGHAITAILLGAQLHEFQIFPEPYVLCKDNLLGDARKCLIGVAGMVFPFLLSCLLRIKRFWPWLAAFFVKFISALSFGLSSISILCYQYGSIWKNEDIIRVIQVSKIHSSVWLLISLIMFCLAIITLYIDKPFERIEKYILS